MKTQVAIIGGGPAGMLLSEILHRAGVDSVVLERRSRAYVLSRIRAGVLEPGTVEVLRANGLGERMDREGHAHDGMKIVWAGRDSFFIDVKKHVGKRFMAYGQTSIQEDLFAAADRRKAVVLDEAEDVQPVDVASDQPHVTFRHRGESAYERGTSALLEGYSDMALRRVWGSVRISWWLTNLLHRFPGMSEFDQRAQEFELQYVSSSLHAQAALAEQYAGMPFEEAA